MTPEEEKNQPWYDEYAERDLTEDELREIFEKLAEANSKVVVLRDGEEGND